MRLRGFPSSLLGTAQGPAMAFLILIGADRLNSALAFTSMTNAIAERVLASGLARLLVVALIIVICLFLGCLMESTSMIVLTAPIFHPTIMKFDLWGLSPGEKSAWFGRIASPERPSCGRYPGSTISGAPRSSRSCDPPWRHPVAHAQADFFIISARRRASQTISPRWLRPRWMKVTMPCVGRDMLSRLAAISVCARSVSP